MSFSTECSELSLYSSDATLKSDDSSEFNCDSFKWLSNSAFIFSSCASFFVSGFNSGTLTLFLETEFFLASITRFLSEGVITTLNGLLPGLIDIFCGALLVLLNDGSAFLSSFKLSFSRCSESSVLLDVNDTSSLFKDSCCISSDCDNFWSSLFVSCANLSSFSSSSLVAYSISEETAFRTALLILFSDEFCWFSELFTSSLNFKSFALSCISDSDSLISL